MSDANALPHCGLQSNQGPCVTGRCSDASKPPEKMKARPREGKGTDVAENSCQGARPPRELESFLLAVRTEGSSWVWGSDLEVQGSGGRDERTENSRLTWGPWGRPCLQKGLNKTNLPANQSGGSGKWGRLFYVATEPPSQPARRQR